MTGAWTMLGKLSVVERKPIGVDVALRLESALKALLDVAHPEAADSAAWDRVVGRVEDPEDHVALPGGDDVAHGLDLVKVEWVVASHGAVEPSLEEGGPLVAEGVRTSLVVLANTSHTTVHTLERGES